MFLSQVASAATGPHDGVVPDGLIALALILVGAKLAGEVFA